MRYGKRMMLALGLIALMLGSLVGPPAAQAQSVVKIGVEGPITGPLAKMGQELANAVRLAAEEWNKKGGVLGKKIEVVELDDQNNPQAGVSAAEKAVADPAVVGVVIGVASAICIHRARISRSTAQKIRIRSAAAPVSWILRKLSTPIQNEEPSALAQGMSITGLYGNA